MELTTSQKSAFISEMLSSEAGINELIRVLLDTFSKQERALFVEEHEGEQCNGFRPRGSVRKEKFTLFHTENTNTQISSTNKY
ncbi:hypothetical protein HQ34_09305 [Porphyromonas cangingivalis]|nr:hypothetical protein [Porphyromonas cangingivalis]KGL47476.1 hypothetical protein HQ34_09305 [Porphyromonas cangingivalis]